MPSTYAHYRFGCEVFRRLPKEMAGSVRRYRPLYLAGLHGPDLMFYYKPLIAHPVNQIGYELHNSTGKDFFERGVRLVRESSDPDMSWAYLCGVVCHFVLDSFCHPYVEEKIQKSHVKHTEIEGAFDRALMVHDGLNPVAHRLTDHILPTETYASVIAPFYAPATAEQVHQAMKSMIRYNGFLTAPSPVKRAAVRGILKLSGNYPEMHGMMITEKKDRRFADSDQRLYEMYKKGLHAAPSMIREIRELLEKGTPPGPRFAHTFGAE